MHSSKHIAPVICADNKFVERWFAYSEVDTFTPGTVLQVREPELVY